MNCKNIEKSIFLYKELSATERALVDKHIIGWSSCKELLMQLNHQHQLIRKASEIPMPVDSSEGIKSRIMKGIDESSQGIDLLDSILLVFKYRWPQSAMGIVSIILIGFFFSEISSVGDLKFKKTYQVDAVTLDTQHFLKSYIKRRESAKAVSLYDHIKKNNLRISKN